MNSLPFPVQFDTKHTVSSNFAYINIHYLIFIFVNYYIVSTTVYLIKLQNNNIVCSVSQPKPRWHEDFDEELIDSLEPLRVIIDLTHIQTSVQRKMSK